MFCATCGQAPPPALPPARPQVTAGVVLTALERIGLPALAVRTQPEDKTLVNFDTNFFTEPHTFEETVTLLGQAVRVQARPVAYLWHYGDGGTESTAGPGAPYPRLLVTHRYLLAHRTVRPSVDVSYAARFTVGDGDWQDITGTVTIAGPGSDLRISEAAGVLSGDYG
ncbi:MAG: hypothetical protein WB441_03195 [Nocardioidaceae bacterium]